MKIHAIRLKPEQDLRVALEEFVNLNNILAGWIVSCAGSLRHYHIRFANQDKSNAENGYFEIIGLSGTLSAHGSHLHIAVSNQDGAMTGGHLLQGCIIYTTAEIIIGESPDLIFTRENDGTTPWQELQITKK